MKRAVAFCFVAFSFLLCGLVLAAKPDPPKSPAPAASTRHANAAVKTAAEARTSLAKLPLSFEENQGQTDAKVKYVSRGDGYSVFLTQSEAVLALGAGSGRNSASGKGKTGESVLWLRTLGSNASAEVSGEDKLPGRLNIYKGDDSRNWHTGIALFGRVTYHSIYPGIDLTYYGNQGQIESDYAVAPGADPRSIEFEVDGASETRFDANGDLVMVSGASSARLLKPVVYQVIGGKKLEIDGRYVFHGANRVGFEVGAYDAKRRLVIDPTIVFSTYLGGSSLSEGDSALGVALRSGNAFVTGSGSSTDFPGADPSGPIVLSTEGFAYVTEFNSTGSSLVYSTLLQGTEGFETAGNGIALDGSGNAYIAGTTDADDFPMLNAYQETFGSAQQTGFVAALSSAGTLTYSTYWGGRNTVDISQANGIAVDSSGKAFVVGSTNSENFPTINPLTNGNMLGPNPYSDTQNAVVAEFNSQGQPVYSTYLNGMDANGETDYGSAIAIDSSDDAYVTGSTTSATWPTTTGVFQTALGGNQNAYVSKLSFNSGTSALSLAASTYFGGNSQDSGNGIALDSSGNVYVTGYTTSSNFPTHNPVTGFGTLQGGRDAFITKLNSGLSALTYSTYLGGSGSDTADAIALDAQSSPDAFVAGYTASPTFPLDTPLQGALGTASGTNAFVTEINGAGSAFTFSTYLGGDVTDSAYAIAVDSSSDAYVAGETESPNFPVQGSGGGAPFQGKLLSTTGNAFLTEISPNTVSGMNFFPSSFNFQADGLGQASLVEPITLSNNTGASAGGISISITGTNQGDFSQTNTCGTSLAAGTSCTVNVTFKPTDQDARTAQITLASSAATNGTVALSGTGAVPEISLSSTSLNFGTSDPLNFAVPSGVIVTNTGGATLHVGSAQLNGTNPSAFTVSNGCTSVAPNASCEISATFTPTAAQAYSASLLINDDAAGSPQTLSLSGTGVGVVSVSPSSAEFNFEIVGTKSVDREFTLENGSGGNITLGAITFGGSYIADFQDDSTSSANTCSSGLVLASGSSCSYVVFFQPTATGPTNVTDGRTATVTFNWTGALTGNQTVNVMGDALTGISLYLTTIPVPSEYVGVTGSGGADLFINGTANPATVTSIVLSGNNPGDFTVTLNSTCAPNGVVPANTYCTINGTFTPSALGVRSVIVTINYTVSGVAQTPLVATASGTGIPGPVTFPSTGAFGSEIEGSTTPSQRFVLQNIQKVPLAISSITNPANADFAVLSSSTCSATTIPAGGKCYFDVTFKPSTTGAETSSLTVNDNGPGSPRTLNLSGTGEAPSITTSTSLLDFGNVIVGKNATAGFFLTNGGNTAVTVTVAPALTTPTGTPFTFVTGSGGGTCAASVTILAQGGTCSVVLKFAPTATGEQTNAVTITESSGSGTLHTINIQGDGVDQGIAGVSPSFLSFSQGVGTTSSAQTVTLTNTGNGPLTVASITFADSSAADFSIDPGTTTCTVGGAIPPTTGNTCTVGVKFAAPSSPASVFAYLEIGSNLGNGVTTTSYAELEGIATSSGGGTLTVTPNPPVAFGSVGDGFSVTSAEYTVVNNTSAAVTFTGTSFTTTTNNDNGFSIAFQDCTGSAIQPQGECFFEVGFLPTTPGTVSNTLNFAFTGGSGVTSPLAISLSGTGAAAFVANPNPVAFTAFSVGTTSPEQQLVYLQNGGASTITINSVGNPTSTSGAYSIGSGLNFCPATTQLSPGSECELYVNYQPTAPSASDNGQFVVNYMPSGGSATNLTVNLTGSAAAAQAVISTPPSGPLTFGSQSLNTQSGIEYVVVTNTGTAPLTFSSLRISTTDDDFSLATPGTSSCQYASLTNGQSCTIAIAFTPSQTGARNGTLTITDNSYPTATQTVSLTGTGSAGGVTATPSSLTFPQTFIGSSTTLGIVVTNTTAAPVTFTSIGSYSGPYSTDTTQTQSACANGGQIPAAGGECVVYVKFTPTVVSNTNSGLAVITYNGSGTINVNFTGASASATVNLSPSTLTFPTVTVTSSAQMTFSLINGTASSITFSGFGTETGNTGDFAVASGSGTTCTAGLTITSGGGSCVVTVTFSPQAGGARSATLPVNYSGGTLPETLNGTGDAPATIVTSSGTPQSVAVNTAYATLQVTVKDGSSNPLSGAVVTFTAPSSGASGTFADSGTRTTTAITNASGVATAATFTANGTPGAFTLTATVSSLGPVNFSLTNLTGTPGSIAATAGTPQSAAISTAFTTNLAATVEDSQAHLLSGVTVTFTAPSSGASGTFANGTTTTTAITNASGIATASTFTANSTVGGPYTATATATGVGPADFSLTNTAGPPASIAATAGTPQTATVGIAFTNTLQATVKDSGGNPLSGVVVTFTAPTSGASGTFANSSTTTTATTNSSGVATASAFTANTKAGTYTVTASVSTSGVTPANFSLTNQAGAAASIIATTGSGQSAAVTTAFATTLAATVEDSDGNPVVGVSVTFAAPGSGASGTFANGTATTQANTNASGVATATTFTANGAIGPYTVTATATGAGTANFSLTNQAGPPATIAATAGSGQSAAVTTAYGTAFQATVKDAGGNPVSNFTVTFTAPSSGASGTFANGTATTQATTNSSGIATATTFTANITSGGVTVTASVSTSGVTAASFSVTNTAGPAATITATAGTPQTTTVGTAFSTALQATVKDSHGNLVPSVNVTFTAPGSSASGTFAATHTATTTVATNSSGVATSTVFTANTVAGGPYNVTATSGSATSATFALTNLAGVAATITATAGSGQSAAVTATFGTALQATVVDTYGNPVPSATVTFTAPGSGASGTFANGTATTQATTSASGVATATAFKANTIAGAYSVTATSGTATSASFSLTNNPGAAAAITATAGASQSTAVNTAFATALGATVKDANGNVVPNVTVTFTAPSSGASGMFANGTATTQATTNASGVATATTFTANSTPGGPYSVTASATGATSATFSLTNLAGTPASITATAGTPQTVTISTAFGTALQATVDDSHSAPLQGVVVTFTAPTSGASGKFSDSGTNVTTATTNASGIATAAAFTANATAGSYTVGATAGAVGPANFSLTNQAGPASTITATAGATQSATVGVAFGTAMQATVKDSGGNLLSGITVTFTAPTTGASGTFADSHTSSTTAVTNSSGIATAAAFTANSTAGAYTVTAKVGSVGPANFSLTNNPAALAVISASGGGTQSVAVNTAFAALQVTAKDAFGNPIQGVVVTFTAPGSGASGTFANGTATTQATTNGSGIATVTFTANNTVGGPYAVTASSGTATSATFNLTNLAGTPASITITAGSPQSAAINAAFATALAAIVKDNNGNPLSGVVVTFTAPTSGASGTFANGGTNSTTAMTNASGVATASTFTANGTAGGPYNVGATAGTLSAVNFALTNLSGPPASITATAGATQSATVGAAFATALQVTVKDAGGNLLSGVIVTFTAPGTGASGTFSDSHNNVTTATTNSSGVATAATFTANTTAGGPYTVGATATGVGPANFTLTNNAGPVAAITATAGNNQSATISTQFTTALQATAKDSDGNLVSGATITFTVTAASNGASGTFAGNTTSVQATTNASGVATATAFSANGTAGSYTIAASSGSATSATFNMTNLAGPPASIAATAGTPQSTPVSSAFTTALAATVKDSGGNLVNNAAVTFTVVPVNGAGATFAGGAATAQVNTNSSGVATAPALTANATGGAFTVSATVTGVTQSAVFTLTSTVAPDVTITSSHTGDFVAGANDAYTIKVTNNGTGQTTGNVVVTDTLPAGLTFVSNTGTGWGTCTTSGQTVTCTYTGTALAAAGGNSTFTITVSVAPNAYPSVANSVAVSDPGDSKTTDKSATDATNVDNALPTLAALPAGTGVIAGSTSSQTITLTGTGFNSSTVVNFGTFTISGSTANAAGTSLTVTVPSADASTAGPVTVTVTNPKNPTTNNGGGQSATSDTVTVVAFSVALPSGAAGTSANPVAVTGGTPAMIAVDIPTTPSGAALPAALTPTCTVPSSLTSATCTVSSNSIATGTTNATFSVTVNTVAQKGANGAVPPSGSSPRPFAPKLLWLLALALAAAAAILTVPRQRFLVARRGQVFAALILLASVAALAGCSGGGGPAPTPAGPASITVGLTSSSGASSTMTIYISVSN